jgi:hypothetical protein
LNLINNNSEARMKRGMAILETNRIDEQRDGSFAVPSQTSTKIIYEVKLIESIWVCSCPDFEYRHVELVLN